MTFIIKTSRSFEKDFEKLDAATQSRVLTAIEKLRVGPLQKAKKLVTIDVGAFRIRIGDYRLRFDVIGKEVLLYRIRHRKEVYR